MNKAKQLIKLYLEMEGEENHKQDKMIIKMIGALLITISIDDEEMNDLIIANEIITETNEGMSNEILNLITDINKDREKTNKLMKKMI